MKICPICEIQLAPTLTKQGVEVDICPQCEGIWLDKDEIYLFTRIPTYIRTKLKEGLEKKFLSQRRSPIDREQMFEVPMFDGDIHIYSCGFSEGIWLDHAEIQKMPPDKCAIEVDRGVFDKDEELQHARYGTDLSGTPGELLPLPNLAIGSASVLVGMYLLLSLVLITFSLMFNIPASTALLVGVAIVAIQFAAGPFIMDLMLRFLYRVEWAKHLTLPGYLEEFLEEVCREKGITFPRIGIIPDGAPQAFTYGHHPNNGRIILSQGLLDLLDEEEVQGVVAHEVGHMVHWDMLIMTAAQLVPLLFYYVFRTVIHARSGSSGRDNSAAPRMLIAVIAYVLFIISEYIVLWFSRIREYYADRFAGEVTGKPDKLASALVKIGYGLAGQDPIEKVGQNKRDRSMKGIEALGIFDVKQANTMAICSQSSANKMGSEIDKDVLKDVARWDLWNPWAAYYEIHSTHPLIAKRIRMLSNLSLSMNKEPYVEFNEKRPESYWDSFWTDLVIYLLPTVILILGGFFLFVSITSSLSVGLEYISLGPAAFYLLALGGAFLVKTLYSYPTRQFAPVNIMALLKKVRVSAVSTVPCRIEGMIIGRGVPGLIYSEDFVLQDKTGIIFLDYRQPLAIFNFFFGLLRAKDYHDQNVEIIGWYRRAPIPYIEIKELRIGGKVSKCYVYQAKLLASIGTIVLGLLILIF